MSTKDWLTILSLIVDILKALIPYVAIYFFLDIFREELKTLIKNGGFKVTAPGISIETINQQQEHVSSKEKKEIEILNAELENTKKAQRAIQELQQYTARDKDTFWLGYHLERTYRLIFPSQMVILVSAYNNGEINDTLARSVFSRTVWCKQFKIPYEQFIGFLIGAGLLVYESSNSRLITTPVGKVFIEYLNNNGIPNKLPPTDVAS